VNDVIATLRAALLDRYDIQRELGGGGMSRVFVATETALGRDVVIKVISPDVMGEAGADRFAREVRLAARLQHANIVLRRSRMRSRLKGSRSPSAPIAPRPRRWTRSCPSSAAQL